uniref:Uncharacterized protein n=1 Tax=Pristionchus pacificus TaxID=54126 RepID=A0A2A6CFT5_PRIPA|eukprot:PDM76913.1 hypothetical protein PRIPAC_42308 [Pristionchus pacificus]
MSAQGLAFADFLLPTTSTTLPSRKEERLYFTTNLSPSLSCARRKLQLETGDFRVVEGGGGKEKATSEAAATEEEEGRVVLGSRGVGGVQWGRGSLSEGRLWMLYRRRNPSKFSIFRLSTSDAATSRNKVDGTAASRRKFDGAARLGRCHEREGRVRRPGMQLQQRQETSRTAAGTSTMRTSEAPVTEGGGVLISAFRVDRRGRRLGLDEQDESEGRAASCSSR